MAEINILPKNTRLQRYRPLLVPIPAGANLSQRLDLPRYQPPKPKGELTKQTRKSFQQSQGEAQLAAKNGQAGQAGILPTQASAGPLGRSATQHQTAQQPQAANSSQQGDLPGRPAARPPRPRVHPPPQVASAVQFTQVRMQRPPNSFSPTPQRPDDDEERLPAPRRDVGFSDEANPQTSEPVRSTPKESEENLSRRRPRPAPIVSLSELLYSNPDLPAHTAILGICEDELPMLLDLYDPAPGALLVIGDERQQQLDLLRTAVASVALRNTARGMQFIVFSHLPAAWSDWVSEQGFDRYCLGVVGVDGQAAQDWIQQLAEWAEQRRMGQRTGPPVLMLMDTLNFLPKLSYEQRLNFELLVKEGPQAAIWPIAAISTALANSLARHISIFQTFLFGYTEDPGVYIKMAGLTDGEARSFVEPGEFAVKVNTEAGEDWMRFRLPSPG